MVSTRAKLLTAVALAGGAVGSLSAQSPSGPVFAAQSFEVLPPRRLAMPQPPSIYDEENIPVGFFTASHRQPISNPPGSPGTNPNSWLSPPRGAVGAPPAQPRNMNAPGFTVMPLFGKPQIPGQPQSQSGPLPHAPAWRWHGYGSTNSAAAPAHAAITSPMTTNPGLHQPEVGSTVLPMPTPVPMPMPAGPVLPSDSRQPTSLPSFSPAPSGPINAVPLPMGPAEPSWKPLDSRSGFFPNQPREIDAGIRRAGAVAPPADPSSVSRAAFVPSPEPASPPPATTTDGPLVVLRSTIETVIAGRGRDLEMYYRSPNHLLVRLKVRAAAEAEQTANLISRLPEIAPYQVTYEIEVAP